MDVVFISKKVMSGLAFSSFLFFFPFTVVSIVGICKIYGNASQEEERPRSERFKEVRHIHYPSSVLLRRHSPL